MKIIAAHEEMVGPLLLCSAANGQVVLISADVSGAEEACRWDIDTGRRLFCFRESYDGVNDFAVASAPDGRLVLAAAFEDGVGRWDALTGELLGRDVAMNTVWSIAAGALPDGRVLLAGAGNDHVVHRWDIATGVAIEPPLEGHGGRILAVDAVDLPDGAVMIASGGEDETIRRWDGVTGRPIGKPLSVHASRIRAITSVTMHDSRVVLGCADSDGVLHRWDAASGERFGDPVQTPSDVSTLTAIWIHGVPQLITSHDDGVVRRWDAKTGHLLDASLSGYCSAAATLPDESAVIATGSRDGFIVIHRVAR